MPEIGKLHYLLIYSNKKPYFFSKGQKKDPFVRTSHQVKQTRSFYHQKKVIIELHGLNEL